MQIVIYLEIRENEQGQRLDRFLRKYMSSAPLSLIYKTIRKNVKVNGKRANENYVLAMGDSIALYMSEQDFERYSKKPEKKRAKKQFTVVYEDENLLAVNKPFGLLTHGDAREKKNHLANQVLDYLIEQGEYDPRSELVFTPAPANRIDRNTTGLVVFGKNAVTLREMNRLFKSREVLSKHYLAIARGSVKDETTLVGKAVKDSEKNRVSTTDSDGKYMETLVHPLMAKGGYSLLDVELITGRTHQIRLQLSEAGYPIIGDPKYGSGKANQEAKHRFGLDGQLLHAWKLAFDFGGTASESILGYMDGRTLTAPPDERISRVLKEVFGIDNL